METLRFVLGMFSIGVMVLGPGVAAGQNYPNKPIRIIASGVGGTSDFMARLIAQKIAGSLGQQAIVENRPGIVQAEIVSRAPPDGYTLLFSGGIVWITPLLQKTIYDPLRDFSPITMVERSPNIFAVHPSLPVKSIKELIALAKARPGELNYSTSGIATSPHLSTELFNSMAGIKTVHVPYKGNAPGVNALIAGEVQLTISSATSLTPHVRSGRLRGLAVTSAEPSALAPGLPTVAASGLPGYESVGMTGVFAPARTPDAIIRRLNEEIVRFLRTAEAKEAFFNRGADAVSSSPEELAAAIRADMDRLGKVIKDTGIRAE